MSKPRSLPRRVLLKLSGESLLGRDGFGVDPETLRVISSEISQLALDGVQVGLVVGGGNLFRGHQLEGIGVDRITGDQIGMLATIMNAVMLRDALKEQQTRLMSTLPVPGLADPVDYQRARQYLAKGHIVIFAGGTGNPFFTTDTAAVLRGIEINCDLILKATKVDYVYDKDPKKHKDAQPFKELSYRDAIARELGVMDMTALALAMEHQKPMRVFSIETQGNLALAVRGQAGTLIHPSSG